jgi:hypothetical protein
VGTGVRREVNTGKMIHVSQNTVEINAVDLRSVTAANDGFILLELLLLTSELLHDELLLILQPFFLLNLEVLLVDVIVYEVNILLWLHHLHHLCREVFPDSADVPGLPSSWSHVHY